MTCLSARNARALPVARIVPTLVLLALARPAAACAVCFGNPESPLTRGVGAGVLVLAGVISTLLLGVASVAAFWTVRARRLQRQR